MTFYEKLVETVSAISDIRCFDGTTNEETGYGTNIDDDMQILIDNENGDISFVNESQEILVLPKNGLVMEMLNNIYEEFE